MLNMIALVLAVMVIAAAVLVFVMSWLLNRPLGEDEVKAAGDPRTRSGGPGSMA